MQAALRPDSQLFPAVFQALRKIDTEAFIREGRVYGGGLYKMEPKELGRLSGEPVLKAICGCKLARQGMLFVDASAVVNARHDLDWNRAASPLNPPQKFGLLSKRAASPYSVQ